MLKLSVVIPCFNAAGTITAAIESVRRQGEVDIELVVVDDGSTDNSLAVIRSFESGAVILTGPNRGASAARNRGIAETTGEWLVFLDADDLLLPGTLPRRLEAAAATGADVIVCNWQELVVDGDGTVDGLVRRADWDALVDDPEIACATHFWATTAALMYRRSLVERIGGFREDLPVIQDARYLFDAASHGASFAHSPHVGARYFLRPHSLSHRHSGRFWRDVLLNGQQIEALWRSRGPLSRARCEALRAIFDHAARGLLAAGDPGYFEAVAFQRRLGLPLTLHPRIVGPLASAVGIGATRQLLRFIGY
jgi:glycosyltransferase involved in cell wall biosynthesis